MAIGQTQFRIGKAAMFTVAATLLLIQIPSAFAQQAPATLHASFDTEFRPGMQEGALSTEGPDSYSSLRSAARSDPVLAPAPLRAELVKHALLPAFRRVIKPAAVLVAAPELPPKPAFDVRPEPAREAASESASESVSRSAPANLDAAGVSAKPAPGAATRPETGKPEGEATAPGGLAGVGPDDAAPAKTKPARAKPATESTAFSLLDDAADQIEGGSGRALRESPRRGFTGLADKGAPPAQPAAEITQTIGRGADPFDTPNKAALLVLQLRMDRLILDDALLAFETSHQACLYLGQVAKALEFAIDVHPGIGRAEGWVVSEDRTFVLDGAAETVKLGGRSMHYDPDLIWYDKQGICVEISLLNEWFPVEFSYNVADLAVDVKATELLPVQERLARENRQQNIRDEHGPTRPGYKLVREPYRAIGWPAFDVTLDSGASSDGGLGVQGDYSVAALGDLAYMNGRLFVAGDQNAGVSDASITLSRIHDDGTALGPIGARKFAIGDVNTPSVDLIADSGLGRGFTVSSFPLDAPDQFSQTTIRGFLPSGWQAELYRDQNLIAFVSEPNENQEYVFEDVLLRFGYNNFTVKLFGPRGERREEAKPVFVGDQMLKPGKAQWSLSLVQQDHKVFGIGETESSTFDDSDGKDGTGMRAVGQAKFGLSDKATVGASFATYEWNGEDRLYGSFDLESAFGGFSQRLALAMNDTGGTAAEAAVITRIGDRLSVSATHREYKSFSGEEAEANAGGDLKRASELQLDSSIVYGRRLLPFNLSSTYEETRTGQRTLDNSLRVSTRVLGANVLNRLEYDVNFDDDAGPDDLDGRLLISYNADDLTFRGGMDYTLSPDASVDFLHGSTEWRITPRTRGNLGVSHSIEEGMTSADASFYREFERFTLGAGGNVNTDGDFSVGINLSFALARNPQTNKYHSYPGGLASEGMVLTDMFKDLNGDGLRGPDEPPIKGASFIVGNSIDQTQTGDDGTALLSGLRAGSSVDIEPQIATIPDPFLIPSVPGWQVEVRPGVVTRVAFPMIATGVLEGTVTLVRNGGSEEIADVPILLLGPDGKEVARGTTEFDGYYAVEKAPLGDYTVVVDPKIVAKLGARTPPARKISISDAEAIASGIDFRLVIGDEGGEPLPEIPALPEETHDQAAAPSPPPAVANATATTPPRGFDIVAGEASSNLPAREMEPPARASIWRADVSPAG